MSVKFVQRVWSDWGAYVLPDGSDDMGIILNAVSRVFHGKSGPGFNDAELNEIVLALRNILQVHFSWHSLRKTAQISAQHVIFVIH